MDILVEHGKIEEKEYEIVVLGVFENETSDFTSRSLQVVDSSLNGAIRDLLESKEFSGKLNTIDMLRTKDVLPTKRILLVGLGKKDSLSLERLRQVSGKTAVRTRELNIQEIVTTLQEFRLNSTKDTAQAVIEGSILGLYQFKELKTESQSDSSSIKSILLLERDMGLLDELQ